MQSEDTCCDVFANLRSPARRGSNVNTNRLRRQDISQPPMSAHGQKHLEAIALMLNGRARMILCFFIPQPLGSMGCCRERLSSPLPGKVR